MVGFVGTAILLLLLKATARDPELFSEPAYHALPPRWMPCILILIYTSVSRVSYRKRLALAGERMAVQGARRRQGAEQASALAGAHGGWRRVPGQSGPDQGGRARPGGLVQGHRGGGQGGGGSLVVRLPAEALYAVVAP